MTQPANPQSSRPANRLAKETSPYLRQHRHNPVDWYPWGPEALERARQEGKPIFLSIGYAACHWCHVMERESFEDPAIAALLNAAFVNVKVDREERPDLDEIYMTAVQAITGHGGWPMSVFLTPDLKPIYAGTYFPPDERHGLPSFRRVIGHVERFWRERRAEVEKGSAEIAADVRRHLTPALAPGEPQLAHADAAALGSLKRLDPVHGGFGSAPKFPHASELTALLRHHARTGDAESLHAVELTLERMARGGIYDQLGGGFHRYSTDREWLVPHFEKMLYDNAQLARLYTEAWVVTRNPLHQRVARETLEYLLREMQHADGGFFSSQDADSEGEEGRFFVWDRAEVEALCGTDTDLVCRHYGITTGGNWEHRNVLALVKTGDELARERGLDPAEVETRLARARAALLAARTKRPRPATDDKVLAAWNGLAIGAFAAAHQAFGEERWLRAAQRAAGFVLDGMVRDGRLLRSWRDGRARLNAYLEDYAMVAEGLLCLFQSDFDPRWLRAARDLLQVVEARFVDRTDGAFCFTADDHEALLARSKSLSESSTPSGAAVAVQAFLQLAALTGEPRLEAVAARALRGAGQVLQTMPGAAPSLLVALELWRADGREVVLAGNPDDPQVRAMLARVRAAYPPHHVVLLVHAANRKELEELSGVVRGKVALDGKATAYVCRHGACEAPVQDPAALRLR
ncbi:MAG: thioredoxin domain-containing protein [Planctomycetes bacterium]|nr:thioredoxin domain-containing protein [Planctomycetota bacterium]